MPRKPLCASAHMDELVAFMCVGSLKMYVLYECTHLSPNGSRCMRTLGLRRASIRSFGFAHCRCEVAAKELMKGNVCTEEVGI